MTDVLSEEELAGIEARIRANKMSGAMLDREHLYAHIRATSSRPSGAEDMREAAAKIVIGWRECDWPEGFDRRTAELMAEDRAARIRALPIAPQEVSEKKP